VGGVAARRCGQCEQVDAKALLQGEARQQERVAAVVSGTGEYPDATRAGPSPAQARERRGGRALHELEARDAATIGRRTVDRAHLRTGVEGR
jgi:hypothetical protein